MSDFDRLRRGNYQPDATHKAIQQEAGELSRESYHPDAVAKAEEQEAAERAEERAARARRERRGDAPSRKAGERRPSGRDLADHTVIRRTTPRQEAGPSGGAVVSRRSGIGVALRRMRSRHAAGADERARQRELRRQEREWERAQRGTEGSGHGPGRALIAFVGVIVALYLVICLPIDRAIAFSRDESKGLSHELSWHVPGLPYYVLALGSDAREGDEVSRTDTMILVRVDPLRAQLTMLSIPRDTKVEIEGYGTQKINAAYAFGGVAGAVREAHELTGASISQAALIKFDGVESLVDYLGGVTVNVPVDVYDPEYTGLVLPAGEQEMDGHTALLFSRVRHGFDLGDYQRQKDQRILIEAIMHEVLSLSPTQMPGVVGHMGGLVGTSMRSYSILPLMLRLKLARSVTIYQATVPSTTAMIDGVSYVVADDEALSQMMRVIDAGGDPATLM